MPRRSQARTAAPSGERSRLAYAAIACVVLLAVVLSLRQVGSLDAGFHLAVGESILAGEGWPGFDRFTYTMGEHRYVDTSWGYQVLLALVERAGGAPAMVLFHSALLLVTLALVLATLVEVRVDPVRVAPLSLVGVLAAEMRFQVRPELLSYVFLAALLLVLHRRAERGHAPLWTVVPLFLVWANCHSLFVLGWIALGCFVVGLALRERRLDRALVGWSAAAVAVTLVNPYGWRAVLFPLTLATRLERGNPFAEAIGEFESPFTITADPSLPFRPELTLWSFRVLFVLVALSAARLAWQRRYAAALLVLPFLFLSAKMVRNMPLVTVACLPGLVWAMSRFGPLERGAGVRAVERTLAVGSLVVAAVLSLRVVTDAHYLASRRVDRFGLGWNRIVEPVDAAAFVRRAALPGRMLNHLNFGGYLMWALDEPVFIDGRLEVVGEEFFEHTYRRALSAPAELERAVERWGIGWIAFPYATNRALLQMLTDDGRWRLVYFDHLAAVFARSEVEAPSAVAGSPPLVLEGLPGLRAPRVSGMRAWLEGCFERQSFPTDDHNRGLFHYYRRDSQRAAGHFAEAVRASEGRYWELYQNLGAALRRLGASADALACYRIVAAAFPGDPAIAERIRELEGSPGTH